MPNLFRSAAHKDRSELRSDPQAPAADSKDTAPCPIYVVIPAAGSGSRMGAGKNKQFLEVGGMPLIVRTLLAFERAARITGYILVTAPDDVDEMNNLIRNFDLKKIISLADGGSSRQESVLLGLRKLRALRPDVTEAIALVHDGARCFISTPIINRCVDTILERHCACGVAVPLKDTIKLTAANGKIEKTIDRSRLWAMQTPQGAFFNDLHQAYEHLAQTGEAVTDDLAAMEAAGYETYLVEGDYANIKMTTPEDLVIGEALAVTY